jgi:hypothetical protein
VVGEVQEGWRVRIRGADGRICGAGVLVDPWQVVTCAHVVATALQLEASTTHPPGAVSLDFPALPGVSRFGIVMTGGWVPPAGDGRGDLAILVLDQAAPGETEPASLGHLGPLDGRSVRAYGHPAGQGEGVWARTRPVGYGGPGGEWVQLDGLAVTGRRVEQGFSGAGVLDENALAVVGLVVAEDLEAANRVAWMLPMERVVQYLRSLETLLARATRHPADELASTAAPPGTVPERRLSGIEQRDLIRRLVAVPGMLDRSARDLYVQAVEQEIGEVVSWRRQHDDLRDVWAMMYALLARPGSLRALVGVLTGMYPRSGEVAALEEYVERTFPDLLLDHGERVELEQQLFGVGWTWVGTAYRIAVAPFGPVVPATSDVVSVIRHLEGYGRLRGGPPPPLLVFVDDLAHKIGGPTEVRLHRWIDSVGGRLEVDRASLQQLCHAAERRRAEVGQVVLTVQLQPDRVDRDRFLMSAWLHHGQQPDERPLLRDDVPRTLDEVSEQLDELLPSVPEHVSVDIDELTIEFILPQRLIGHPVEQWEFNRRGFSRPLGIRYPVVVRSLERLRNRALHDAWRHKWRRVADHGHRPDRGAIHCIGRPGARDPQGLYSELVADDRLVCLTLPFPPQEGEETSGADEFIAGLEAGMPVIVWARHPVDQARFCLLIRDTLAAEGLRGLPSRALGLRRDAARSVEARSPEQFTPAVGVFWDDADRLPGTFKRTIKLQAPR